MMDRVRNLFVCWLCVCVAAGWGSALEAQAKTVVQIGLLDTFAPNFYIQNFAPLVLSLRSRYPQYQIQAFSLDPKRPLRSQFSSANSFIVMESGLALMHPELELEELATRRLTGEQDAAHSTGAVFIVRADSPYRELSQLKGAKAAAADAGDFSGWLVALGEIASIAPNPELFFSNVTFTHWSFPDVSDLVKIGSVDVGILHTCELEEAIRSGTIQATDFRILSEKSPTASGCKRSTELYPNAMFAAFPTAQADVVRNLTVAILTMAPAIDGSDWVTNNRLGAVRRLMKTLQMGPYAYLRDTSPQALLLRWKTPILMIVAGIVFLLLHALRVHMLLQRRTRQLRQEALLHEQAEEAVRQSQRKLDRMEKAGMAALMASMFSHEIKQPLTNVANFLNGILLMKKLHKENEQKEEEALQRAVTETYRAAEIIDRVRSATRRDPVRKVLVDLNEVAKQALQHSRCRRLASENIHTRFADHPVAVIGDALELEIVLVNFLNNAMDACGAKPQIAIRIFQAASEACAEVTDNGSGVSANRLSLLGRPLESSKPNGLGFGLAIADSIAEAHGGHLEFKNNAEGESGFCARLWLPLNDAPSDAPDNAK